MHKTMCLKSCVPIQRASQVIVKETLLSEQDLTPLGNEHKAALDFLVLIASTRAVGFCGSTFSLQLAWLRDLEGPPLRPTFLVGDVSDPRHSIKVQRIIDSGLADRTGWSGFWYRVYRIMGAICDFFSQYWLAAFAACFPILALLLFSRKVGSGENGILSMLKTESGSGSCGIGLLTGSRAGSSAVSPVDLRGKNMTRM